MVRRKTAAEAFAEDYVPLESVDMTPSRAELLEALAAAIEAVPAKSRMHRLPELIRAVLK